MLLLPELVCWLRPEDPLHLRHVSYVSYVAGLRCFPSVAVPHAHPLLPSTGWTVCTCPGPRRQLSADGPNFLPLPAAAKHHGRPELLLHHFQQVEEPDSLSDQSRELRGG